MVFRRSEAETMDEYFRALLNDEMLEFPEQNRIEQDRAVQRTETVALVKKELVPLDSLLKPVSLPSVDSLPLVTHLPTLVPPVTEKAEEVSQATGFEEATAESVDTTNSDDTVGQWQNLETDDEFQVLFFSVAGVVFAVPLSELGGIYNKVELTTLFGKPSWFAGIMLNRDEKYNIVDTLQWVMPEKQCDVNYDYIVMLENSGWGIMAETLLGTEKISRADVVWRTQAGKRPWLAGMVKRKMCVLLHPEQLVRLFFEGVDTASSC